MWKLDDKAIHLEAHLDFNENLTLLESNKIVAILEETLHKKFEITHTTFQCEYESNHNKGKIA